MRIISLTIFLAVLFVAVASAQETKVGYIDLQKVIRDSKAGKAAKASFEKEFQQKKVIIESKKRNVDSLREDFIKNAQVMSESARKQKAEDIDKKEKDLLRTQEDFKEELQKKDFELTQKILRDIEGILKQIGDSGDYAIIIEKIEGGVVYSSKSADVTDMVIQAYDAKQ
ncbi:MAG: OmpH family outer membrane protein [Thermodesulfobacteriota bacterium]